MLSLCRFLSSRRTLVWVDIAPNALIHKIFHEVLLSIEKFVIIGRLQVQSLLGYVVYTSCRAVRIFARHETVLGENATHSAQVVLGGLSHGVLASHASHPWAQPGLVAFGVD